MDNHTKSKFLSEFDSFRLGRECDRLIISLYEGLKTPLALKCLELYKAKDFKTLLSFDVRSALRESGPCQDTFRQNLLAVSLLSKAEWLDIGVDRKQVALEKWLATEKHCLRINKRFRSPVWVETHPHLAKLFKAWRSEIGRVLGPFDFDRMLAYAGWGPGSTASLNGDDVGQETKFALERGVTKRLYDLLTERFDEIPLWDKIYPHWKPDFTHVECAKMMFVPKTAKTDRTICAEPGLNLFFQKGVGTMIAHRLSKAYGYDFRKEASARNQLAAQNFEYATVDFSAASDMISTGLLEKLLPTTWYRMLDILRSHRVENEGVTYPLNKFSSMGNGFTFELETVIFRSLARVIVPQDREVFCFGDDVIIPVEFYRRYCRFASVAGFVVNLEKSFSQGDSFRESCGAYYFEQGGQTFDVKPFFIKDKPNAIRDLFRIGNRWRAIFGQDKTWSRIVRFSPRCYRNPIPPDLGDGGFQISGAIPDAFIMHPDIGKPLPGAQEGVWFRAWVARPVTKESRIDHGLFLARLHNKSEEIALGNQVFLRSSTRWAIQKSRFIGSFSVLSGFIPFA